MKSGGGVTARELGELVDMLISLCPRNAPKSSRAFARAWWLVFRRYSREEIFAAVADYSGRHKSFPAAADIRREIERKQKNAEKGRKLS